MDGFKIIDGVPWVGDTAYPEAIKVSENTEHPHWPWVGFRLHLPTGWRVAVMWERMPGRRECFGPLANAGPGFDLSLGPDTDALFRGPAVEEGPPDAVNLYIALARAHAEGYMAGYAKAATAHPVS